MRTRRFLLPAAASTFLLGAVVLTGCTVAETTASADVAAEESESEQVLTAALAAADEILAANENSTTVNPDEWDPEPGTTITLAGTTATVDGSGASVSASACSLVAFLPAIAHVRLVWLARCCAAKWPTQP